MDACAEWTVIPKPSYNCAIACSYDVEITSGDYAGYTVSMCGGGEPFEGAAGMVGVDDPALMLIMTDFYDDIGLESGHGGSLLGMVWEAYDRGLITKEDTGGLELTWGNYDAFVEVWNQIFEKRDFGGKLLGDMKDIARALNAEHLLVHVKGASINMHDWRPMWGALFGQIISGTGACHQIEYPHLAFDLSNTKVGKKPEMVFDTQKEKLWEDNLGVCMFACQGVKDVIPLAAKALANATGWSDFDEAEAILVGERTVNLMRLIAVSRGLTRSEDFDVGDRLLEAPKAGPAAGAAMGPHLEEMIDRYYTAAGWDLATGYPTPETLARLDLEDIATELRV
jgi:aldehyde:ferredoxin oxidoreductase